MSDVVWIATLTIVCILSLVWLVCVCVTEFRLANEYHRISQLSMLRERMEWDNERGIYKQRIQISDTFNNPVCVNLRGVWFARSSNSNIHHYLNMNYVSILLNKESLHGFRLDEE